MTKKILMYLAIKSSFLRTIIAKSGKLTPTEYASILKAVNYFHSIGENCAINSSSTITDPEYVKIGNNVTLGTCSLIGHDASINVINRAFGKRLDSVGSITIGNNVFIGHEAIVLPGSIIYDNCIVAAGAVVTGSIGPNQVVGGIPAKPITSIEKHIENLELKNDKLPWRKDFEKLEICKDRAALRASIIKQRIQYFFPE